MIALLLALAASPFDTPPPIEFIAAPNVLTETERTAWRTACRSVATRLGWPRRRWTIPMHRAANPGAFAQRTGRPRFEAAAWTPQGMWLQSRATLARFQGLQAVRRHECVHAWRAARNLPPLPIVLEEGLAAGVSQEALPPVRWPPAGEEFRSLTAQAAYLDRLEQRLRSPQGRRDARRARSEATAAVWTLLRALPGPEIDARLRAVAERSADQHWWRVLSAPRPKPPDERNRQERFGN